MAGCGDFYIIASVLIISPGWNSGRKEKAGINMDYIFHIIVMINIYIILSLSTNLLVGMTNLLSLGQAAFYGIGAYLTAFCLIYLQLSLLPALLLVMLITALLSLIIAI